MQYNRAMTGSVRLKCTISTMAILASLVFRATTVLADSTAVPVLPTVALGLRLQYDSAGCPAAVELLLEKTADTIRGLEAVLQWDRPDAIEFLRGKSHVDSLSIADSLSGLLVPKDKSTLLPLETREQLLGRWEFAQARFISGARAKIIAVAQILSDSGRVGIVPGQSGVLCRLPIRALPRSESIPTVDSVTLNLDPMGTHLATSRGDLSRLAPAKPAVARLGSCAVATPQEQ